MTITLFYFGILVCIFKVCIFKQKCVFDLTVNMKCIKDFCYILLSFFCDIQCVFYETMNLSFFSRNCGIWCSSEAVIACHTGVITVMFTYVGSCKIHLKIQDVCFIAVRVYKCVMFKNFFTGNPDPLVFHAPQIFFDCLQQRISCGCKKKRLPNFTTAFVRKDALPLGTFTKYTWHITNILHVKQIFDTPEVDIYLLQL